MTGNNPSEDAVPGVDITFLCHLQWEEEAMAFTIRINGSMQRVDVDGDTPLLRLLRDALDAARVGECNS